ncbi:MAG: Formyl transferase [Candidatus Kentron sp. G]|nr:MAG: Formyl transferase [Candidatus Kentron sp. G]VFM99792.1 MAG: Formyl transferase [Candidatus Kentron sp. G]VFN01083.1 MAG: Formyl transferase [Candidatus Kentron sp. G]
MNDYIPGLIHDWLRAGYRVLWTHDMNELRAADFCFYLGCGQIVPPAVLARFRNNLVVHASDLPQGKGWSPLTWQILEGKNRIPVTLFEAAEEVDSGVIHAKEWLEFEGHELIGELRKKLAQVTFSLCRQFVADYPATPAQARQQVGEESFYPRRGPADSRLDPMCSLAEQFLLLRVVDNARYPAFFEWKGNRYTLAVWKGS